MRNEKAFKNLLAAAQQAKFGAPANKDDSFWRAECDKAGNGYAVIRFLPGKTEDDVPFVKVYSHGFQGPTSKWFIDDCPTTIGQDCPVCKDNGTYWNSGIESDKDIARKRKRRLSYISNVLVVSDPKNPDNEGKVFLFKYGQKIFEKVLDKLDPPTDDKGNLIDPDDKEMNPFDLDEGANFKLKIRKVEGFSNFDKSEFEGVSKVKGAEEIITKINDLGKFIDPANFKSYAELEQKLNRVLNQEEQNMPVAAKPKPAPKIEEVEDKVNEKVVDADAEEDDIAYFARLAESE